MAAKRLFFALWPSREVRDAIVKGTRALVRESGGRAVVPENLHITLTFLGNVDATRVDEITDVAGQLEPAPFTLSLDSVEFWKKPRILAICASTPPELLDLVQNLGAGLEKCDFTPEKRPYRAHMTLARKARRMPGADPDLLVNWALDDFVLVESVTDAKGARYSVLRRWEFGT